MKPSVAASRETASNDTLKLRPRGRETSVILIGASFKTSTIAFRERFATLLSREARELWRLAGAFEHAELVTCNRVEVMLATRSFSIDGLSTWLSRISDSEPGATYVHRDSAAIAHTFRVASGMDSLVPGEEQILTQVKEAGEKARRSGSSLGHISAIFDASVNAGRRIRAKVKPPNESVSSRALDFALSRLHRPPGSVLLIGTGMTARLAANQLGGAKLYVATRRASQSPFARAASIGHSEMRTVARRCDLIIAATKHRGYLLRKGDLPAAQRRVVLDLGFPRNIDPRLNAGRTEVYNLDDLARIFGPRIANRGPREDVAEELLAAEADGFSRWFLASRQSTALARVYKWAEQTSRREVEAAVSRLPGLSARDERIVRALSKRIVSKLLAPPTSFAKSSSPDFPQEQRLEALERVFRQGKDEP